MTNVELQAWLHLRGIHISPFEVGILDKLEEVYIAASTPKPKEAK